MNYDNLPRETLIEMLKEHTDKLKNSGDVYEHIEAYGRKKVEYFGILTMDGASHIKKLHIITKGIVNRVLVHPREVFLPAIKDMATSVVLFHNHPSGNTEPSNEDLELTKRLVKAGKFIGIEIMDHMIVCRYGYNSLRANEYNYLFD